MALSWMDDIYKIRNFLVPPASGSGKNAYSADASSTPLDVTDAPESDEIVVVDFLLIGLSTTAAVVSLYEESNATPPGGAVVGGLDRWGSDGPIVWHSETAGLDYWHTDGIWSDYQSGSEPEALFSMPIGQNSFLEIPKEAIFKLLTAGKKLQLKTSVAAPVYTYCASHGE